MADQRTMAELLRAPTEGYAEVIVVPLILAEHFELKHSLINMMTSDQFFGLEKDNPHDHIRWFNKITSTIKYKDVPNSAIKLMLFPFSLAGAARRWLKKEPPHFILTWEDLVSKFINEFFPSSRTTNLRNEISNFEQCFGESFHEAWDRYKDLLHACPHHGFTELHQLDTFYNALNPTDQYSLNSAAGGNLLERSTQDVLTIIENKSKIAKLTHAVNQQTSVVTIAMTAILKQFQATPPPASVKVVEEICVTCGGAHPYYQCLVADGNTFLEFQDNIQGYVAPATAITTRSGLVLNGPSVPMPPPFINPKEDERVEETLTNSELAEYTIKYQKMLKSFLSNKEKLLELANTPLNENCSSVILKKLPEKLGDPGKFLIPCGFSELKCKALADLVINPLSGNPTPISEPVTKSSSSPTLTSLEESNLIWEEFEAYLASDSFPPGNDDPFDLLLEEFADELALITFPPGNDDLPFDIESDLREIEYLLNHDPTKEIDSILEDSVDDCNIADPNNDLAPPLYDDDDYDLVELESDNDDVYDDPFDSKEDKIKESKLLIDELDPPRSRFFNPPLYELPFHKEVPGLGNSLLSFSSENEEKKSKRRMWIILVVPRLKWRKRKRCGQFCDQGLKGDACKQLRKEVGASLRCLDCMPMIISLLPVDVNVLPLTQVRLGLVVVMYPRSYYPIWEVIQRGNGPVSVSTDTNGQIKVLPLKTVKEILAREKERKARTTLLMAIPEDHLAKFHKMTDAKEMWDAIKSRFGGNDESKKMQKYILKQQFEGFSVSNSKGLHKGYDRFQSLLSQLEIHGAGVSTEDTNQKFLRSLPSSWSQVSLIMRTKPRVDSLSFDDLYNNLGVFETDVKGLLDHLLVHRMSLLFLLKALAV
ncbi:reverse transcriptase domain-containing protein [Tanacetum coccineum]